MGLRYKDSDKKRRLFGKQLCWINNVARSHRFWLVAESWVRILDTKRKIYYSVKFEKFRRWILYFISNNIKSHTVCEILRGVASVFIPYNGSPSLVFFSWCNGEWVLLFAWLFVLSSSCEQTQASKRRKTSYVLPIFFKAVVVIKALTRSHTEVQKRENRVSVWHSELPVAAGAPGVECYLWRTWLFSLGLFTIRVHKYVRG